MLSDKKLEQSLRTIAKKEKVAIITFIAPDKLIRINPARYSSVSIATTDAYNLEKAVDEHCQGIKKIFLLLHSPGGSLSSSYNIARYLRLRFEHIHTFVPYEAASGATIMSLGSNKLTLGDLGYLTPIDPQVPYEGNWVSSYGIIEKVSDFEKRFKNMTPAEIPVPWREMLEKLDVIPYREMETSVWEAQMYAVELLVAAGYEKKVADLVASTLARNIYTHSHCYHRKACDEMGLNIDNSENAMEYLRELKKLVHHVNDQTSESLNHYIEVILPSGEDTVVGASQKDPLITEDVSRTKRARKR